ncbi:hypothetical protein [Paraburkholderia bannensis]|uniref:hypothetical protein n=1 Tax=Paraburkholderia bannensis TaxID=765414 RepID=UPI002AB7F1BE|nr:hypothetical protein [Paraburkholderia bannensis]
MAIKTPGSILVRILVFLCLFNSCLASAGTIRTAHELDAALESAVQCKLEAWEKLVDSNEESGSEVFKSLGIVQHSGDVETTYLLPAGTRIFEYGASKVWEVNTSVDVLYVELTAGPNSIRRLKERLHMVAPPPVSPYGYMDYLDARFVKVIKPRRGIHDVDELVTVLGTGYRDDLHYVAIGCWSYSGDPG